MLFLIALITTMLVITGQPVFAQSQTDSDWWRVDGPVCTSPYEGRLTSGPRLLRQITLDLLGRVPTNAEFDLAEERGGGETEQLSLLLDEMMLMPEFSDTMRRYHEKLILPASKRYISNAWSLIVRSGQKCGQDFTAANKVIYRTGTATNARRLGGLSCLPGIAANHQAIANKEMVQAFRSENLAFADTDIFNTQYLTAGSIGSTNNGAVLGPVQPNWQGSWSWLDDTGKTESQHTGIKIPNCTGAGGTCRQEGWVYVNPYWREKVTIKKPVPRYADEIYTPYNNLDSYRGPVNPAQITESDLKDLANYDYQDETFVNSTAFDTLANNPNVVKVCARAAYYCGDRLKNCANNADRRYVRQSAISEVLELIDWAIRSTGQPSGTDVSGIDDSAEDDKDLGYFRFLTTHYTVLDYWLNLTYRHFWRHNGFQFGEDVHAAKDTDGDSWAHDPLENAGWDRNAVRDGKASSGQTCTVAS